MYAPTGHVIIAKANGTLWAAKFDLSTLRLAGRERELPDTASAAGGTIDLTLSSSGTLAYTKALVQSYEVVWVDRSGGTQPVAPDLTSDFVSDPSLSLDGRHLAIALGGTDGNSYIWVKPLAAARSRASRSRYPRDQCGGQRPARSHTGTGTRAGARN